MNKELERMAKFFDRRAAFYEEHMRRSVAGFEDFYRTVAAPIERTAEPIEILDLGCGTGLELESLFKRSPNARITAVDLSRGMLAKLSEKYADKAKQIALIQDSFLEFPIGQGRWNYIVSVMAMHHLTPEEKLLLYRSIHIGLRPGGLYIEGDYVVAEEEEKELLREYWKLRRANPEVANGAYHLDIPLSTKTQIRLLSNAGFAGVGITWSSDKAAVFTARKARGE